MIGKQPVLNAQAGTNSVEPGGAQTKVVAVINTSVFASKENNASRVEQALVLQTQVMHVFVVILYVIFPMAIVSVNPMEPVPKIMIVLPTNILKRFRIMIMRIIINVQVVPQVQQVQQNQLQSLHVLVPQTNT